jgi:hypothetical protein
MICFIVPVYLFLINDDETCSYFGIDDMWRARLSLATPIVCLFSPIIYAVIVMVLIIFYVTYLKEMWEKSFPQKESDK